MNIYFEKLSYILIIILPFSLIAGPAIPDISITLIGLFFLKLIVLDKYFHNIFKEKWVLLSILFWIFLIFISLFSENKFLAYKDALIFIRILLIPIFIYFWILKDEKRIKFLILSIFLSVIFVCLDTFYQFMSYDPIKGFGKDIFGLMPDFYGRLTGPFKDQVPGAYVSKFSLIGLLFIFLNIKNEKLKISCAILYLSSVGLITFISGERMALATFFLGLFFIFIFVKKRKLVFLIAMILIFIIILIFKNIHPAYNDYKIINSTPYHLGLTVQKNFVCENNEKKCDNIITLQPEFLKVISNFNLSAYGQIYKLSMKMWGDHPFQGIGLNNFTFLCKKDERYMNLMKKIGCVTHPHNFYLQWLVETGPFGLLFFILYVFYIFLFVSKNKFNLFTIISLATLLILFWPIMSTGSLLKNWMGVSTFYILGICLSLTKLKQKNL